jgi:hypothetical protein
LDFNALQQSFLDRVDAAGAKSPRGWRAAGSPRSYEVTKGGDVGLAAESLRAWRLCARALLIMGYRKSVSRKGAKSPRGWRAAGLTRSREDHEGWGRGIGCRVFAGLAALRAGPTEHGLPEECFSQRRKVAKGMARGGFNTKSRRSRRVGTWNWLQNLCVLGGFARGPLSG